MAPPHDIGVFPMRDFLGIGGWGVGQEMRVKVIRDGVQIGSAGPMTLAEDLELDGFAEVNHPGGVCWNGVTPNIVAGDRIEAVDADGNGDFTVVQNVEVIKPATQVDADNDGDEDDIVAQGIAANLDGTGRMNPSLVEQRVINPDLKDTTVGRRDVRAIFGDGLADGVETLGEIKWDNPADVTDPHWTATYLNLGVNIATLVEAGQSRMLAWERTDAADNRIGMTLWEYGELGGPGMGGCPATADYAVGGASPQHINTLTQPQGNVTLTGTAHNVDTVKVSVDDHNPATPAVTADAVVAKPVNMTDTTVALPGATTWTASVPMAGVRALDDDTLVASATYGAVKETTTTTTPPDDPATTDVEGPVTTTTRTSSPIGGATLNILKDLTVPAAPTAFPGSGRYTSAQSVAINPNNEIEDTVRYRVGATPATTTDPTAASPVVPNQLPVTTTQTVKARSFDPAGNPSTVATFEYTIGAATPAPAPTAVTATPDDSSAVVAWTPSPDNGGAPVTDWRVQVFQGASTTALRTVTVTDPDQTLNPGELSAPIPNLINGTGYRFRVAAFNGLTPLQYSPLSATVTPTGPVNAAPTVSAQSPVRNATGVGVANNITATFNEAVTGVSATTFTLRAAGATTNVGAAVSYDATTRVATLNPNANLAAGTTYTATLTGGAAAIRDTAGAALSNTSWTFTTAAAANPAPTVSARTPAVNASSVAVANNITATFSEAVNGVGTGTFQLRNPAGTAINGTVTRNGTTNQWILNPAANLVADTRYTVTLTGGAAAIRDLAGAPLATTTWSFTTGLAPTVSARTPAVGASGVARTGNVTATFSEAVQGVTGTSFQLRRGTTVITAVLSRNGTTNQWILNPSVTLAANTAYTVSLTGSSTAIRDVANNPLTSTSWNFTTGAS